jgi:hypothetical protein
VYKLKIIFIFIVFISCTKNNQSFISQEIEKYDVSLGNTDTENIIENVPKIRYVIAQEGLNKRSEPSINGDITGVLLYGERVITHEKSEMADTINGITDYWYRVQYHVNKNEWIFGGYISENLPSDLPIIIGKWDNINSEIRFGYFIESFQFDPNYVYVHTLKKETSNVEWGNWKLNGDIITVNNLKHGLDFNGIKKEIEDIQLEIIDNENIMLKFSNNGIMKLTRSNDLW